MKYGFYLIAFFLASQIQLGAQNQPTPKYLKFEKRLINIGEVKKGEKVDMKFVFTNISNEDIEIDLVSSCECTEVDWPVKAIKPGEKGEISVTFDSNKKDGSETIDVDIILKNTDPKTGNPIFEIVSYAFVLVK